jgi:eukaryotic-like serine/threonine-protein kinase
MADQKVLAGRYAIDSVLGHGGMAEVYLGTDRVLGRQIAVKVLGSQFAKDGSFVARFRREAQSAAALNHPNVVSVFDTGSDDGTHFIVMEYVKGKTLSQIIREDGPLLPERAVEIAYAVAEALAFAHRNGIIHRDVKPGNIMLTPSGDVKVMDFGIARASTSDSLTQTATVLGTATYFSPEQAQGEPVDARSDVYSLGCVLYEMLTAHPPFTGETSVAVAYKHVKEEPVPPSRINPDVPVDLDAVVLKCLAKNPGNRYQSAGDLARDLDRFRRGVPVMATPLLSPDSTQVVERATRPTAVLPAATVEEDERRRRWVAALILGAILLVIAVGLFFFARSLLQTGQLLTVPDVRGKTEAVARDTLTNAGFSVGQVNEVGNSQQPKGVVVDYSPKRAERGTAINLFVSNGTQQATVPRVICESRSTATQDLRDAGFKVRVVGTFNNPACNSPGDVTQQDPEGNTQAQKGSVVRIWLFPQPSPSPSPSPSPPPSPSPSPPPSPSPSPSPSAQPSSSP